VWADNGELAVSLGYYPGNDGTFWMPFTDFANIFDRVVVLPKSMCFPRSVYSRNSLSRIAQQGRYVLGVALSRLASPSNLEAFVKMSVAPYDPYLNAPDWIKQDPLLLSRWIEDKGPPL